MTKRLTNAAAVERAHELIENINYENISDDQHELIVSFEKQLETWGGLTEKQMDILESIWFYSND